MFLLWFNFYRMWGRKMNRRLMLLITSILFTAVILSCTKEKIVASDNSIYGSWERLIIDTHGVHFNAELKIKTDNTFEFILLETVPGHSNSSGEYTMNENNFTVINDADCGVDGNYEYVVSENKLAFVAVADDCAPRVAAMQGVWSKM